MSDPHKEHHLQKLIDHVIKTVFERLEALLAHRPHHARRFQWTVGPITLRSRVMNLRLSLAAASVLLHVAPQDDPGGAAAVDGKPAWSSSNPTFAALTPSDDGLSCLVTFPATAAIGTSVITVTADADTGAGVSEISEECHIEVAAQATKLVVTADDPALRT